MTLAELESVLYQIMGSHPSAPSLPVELAWKWKQGASGSASRIVGVTLERKRVAILIEPNNTGENHDTKG
jgi:hypothetical protein